MTRSTEDLSNKYRNENDISSESSGRLSSTQDLTFRVSRASSKTRMQQQNIPEDATTCFASSIERSTSLHSNVLKTQNQIILPKDYNPIGALNAVENMEVFCQRLFIKM